MQRVVDRMKVKVWMEIGKFERTLCDVVASPLPECVLGMDIVSDWRKLHCKREGVALSR